MPRAVPAPEPQQFASDNTSGICPEALEALVRANAGHAPAYGDDPWTTAACDRFRELFGTDCEVFFVFNGTAANSLALASLCQSYHSIVCHELAHVETDECGGPEFFSNGTKLLLARGVDGKVQPGAVTELVTRRRDIHYPKPRVLSLTQSTECGTVYTAGELRALCGEAKQHGLSVHMDGARFANAVAALGCAPREITWDAGVDVLCFGGTKNGLPVGDAVIFFRKDLAAEFAYRCKQAGQLASKMRFLSAPWLGLLENDVWLKNGRHANAMAAALEEGLSGIPATEILFPRDANAVFVRFPPGVEEALRAQGWRFYNFIGAGGARLMCGWDTSLERVGDFVRAAAEAAAAAG